MNKPNVLVCQHGSRHRYAIPRMLEESGMLSALYTDTSAQSHAGRFLKLLSLLTPPYRSGSTRRQMSGFPLEKVYSSDYPHWFELVQRLLFVRKHGIHIFLQRHRLLSARMRRWGLQDANLVYSMYYENLDFVRWAKQQGMKSAVDVYISPLTDIIMEAEHASFPDWGTGADGEAMELKERLWKEAANLADLLICPSEWVAEGVRTISPDVADKIRIVPYGCSIKYKGQMNAPVKGRILFAGRDPLRKGLHYLAQAATVLQSELPEVDVRIAGQLAPEVVGHSICKELNFLGQLNGEQMMQEFLSADALVLPALSEGFAGVVAEAIGAGCPVIVTKESGSPVVHEREGLIVPSQDADALVEAIKRLVLDRDFREDCSQECLKQVPFYSEMMWKKRLGEALGGCFES